MEKKSFEFSNLFSSTGQDFQERKDKINERRLEKMEFDEQYYFKNKPDWLLGLYKKIDDYCLNEIKKGVERTYLKTYIRWSYSRIMFCRVFVFSSNLKLYLRLKFEEIESAPKFIKDYSDRVRGIPTVEILLDEEFLRSEEAFSAILFPLVSKAFSEVTRAEKVKLAKRIEPVKGRAIEPIRQIEVFRPSINLSLDNNGYININLKIKKSQKEILNRILQETILKY